MSRSSSSSSSFYFLLIVVLVCASVILKTMVPKAEAACEKATIGGGCPDRSLCAETCRPCYRGVGTVTAYCVPAGGPILWNQCICSFDKGAPCNPVGPPRCPAPWPRPDVVLNQTVLA